MSSVSKDPSSTDWDCTQVPSSQATTETCDYAGPTPIAPGTTIPLLFDNTVKTAGTTGDSADDSVSVGSDDAATVVATDYATVGAGPAPNLALTASSVSSAPSNFTLSLNASVLESGGATTHGLTLEVALGGNDHFTSTPSSPDWQCQVSGPTNGLLTCRSVSTAIAPGTSLSAIAAGVAPAASGLHTAQATLTDSMDGALAVSTSSTTSSLVTGLGLTTAGTPAAAAAGSSYTLDLYATVSASGGEAFNDPGLAVTLPAGESFPVSVPTPPGWSCTVPTTVNLDCTSTVTTPLSPGTSLMPVVDTIMIAPAARGSLQATATLSDALDAATAAEQQPSVTVTAPPVLSLATTGTPAGASNGSSYTLNATAAISGSGGQAYNDPTLSATLPAGESFPSSLPALPAWSCAVAGAGNVGLDCTSTTAVPISAGTSLGGISVVVTIAPAAADGVSKTNISLADNGDASAQVTTTVTSDITPTPGLVLATAGSPADASANTSYSLTLAANLTSAGPAYNEPQLGATLPSGETFAGWVASPPGSWGCATSAGIHRVGLHVNPVHPHRRQHRPGRGRGHGRYLSGRERDATADAGFPNSVGPRRRSCCPGPDLLRDGDVDAGALNDRLGEPLQRHG